LVSSGRRDHASSRTWTDGIVDRRTWLGAGRLHSGGHSNQGRDRNGNDPGGNDRGAQHEQPRRRDEFLDDSGNARRANAKPVGGTSVRDHNQPCQL